jgi:type VI secretion system protein ImpB
MSESLQKWLGRNRPPRVHITYDVETRGAIEKKELPFVVGILADLMGDKDPDHKLKDRKFVEVDAENLPELFQTLAPTIRFKVPSALEGAADGDETSIELEMTRMDDFRPENVLLQLARRGDYEREDGDEEDTGKVEAVAALVEERERLAELLARIDLKEDLSDLLREMLGSGDDKS